MAFSFQNPLLEIMKGKIRKINELPFKIK